MNQPNEYQPAEAVEKLISQSYSRRRFFSQAGRGLMAATAFGQLISCKSAQPMSGNTQTVPASSTPPPVTSGTDKVKLKPLDTPTERPKSDPPEYLPPDQRVGYAIVGLGHLSLEELLPAFGQC